MFEPKDEVTASVNALMDLANRYERGQCIPWIEIEKITGPHDDGGATHAIRKWRRRLEGERDIVTLPAVTVGIRLLTHKETFKEIPPLRERKAYRQIRRGIKQMTTIDESRLSDHERRILAAQRTNMADQRRTIFRSLRQIEKGIATEVNPRRRVAS